MRAVITVVGKDTVGILAMVSGECAKYRANVIEVSQSVLQDMFAMIMLVDITDMNCQLSQLSETMKELGSSLHLSIHVMHEDIFNSMHHI